MKSILRIFGFFLLFLSFQYAATAAVNPDELAAKVRETIAYRYADDVEVTADKFGSIELRGEVNTLYDKYQIFEIASTVAGVRTIANKIVVDTIVLPDSLVDANIQNDLRLNRAFREPERIEVTVNDGVVFLDGEVYFYREKLMAQTIASWHEGVKSIVNRLELLPPVVARSDENLTSALSELMAYRFPYADDVTFSVTDGVVTLTGEVSSYWIKENIAEEFANIIGVLEVVNKLKVEEDQT